MNTSNKLTTPSSPKEFFARIYGHLEDNKEELSNPNDEQSKSLQPSSIVTPMPILATSLPFFLPSSNEAHLTAAAAAGLSAFCKIFFYIFIA